MLQKYIYCVLHGSTNFSVSLKHKSTQYFIYEFKKGIGINLCNKIKKTRAANTNPYFGRIISSNKYSLVFAVQTDRQSNELYLAITLGEVVKCD